MEPEKARGAAVRPLLFIHYGNPSYLPIVLRTARRFNPGQRIILLGDAGNRRPCCPTAEHLEFARFEHHPLVREFDAVFVPIQGQRHRFTKLGGTDFWLRFVFRRWFLILAFLESEQIDGFWTFDTDTLILAELDRRAGRFAEYDCTEQCVGACLNGYVGSRHLVRNFAHAMLDMFRDKDFLEQQRARLREHSGLAFNEMDAYQVFRSRAGLRTFRASTPVEGECFDDALAFCDGYVAAPTAIVGRTRIKRLWRGDNGGVYARRSDTQMVRLLSCNMSWMPDFLYRRLARLASADPMSPPVSFTEVPLDEPWSSALGRAWAHFKTRATRWKHTAQG
jgi:hypothetical protein